MGHFMKIATTIGEVYAFTQTPAGAVCCYEGTGFQLLDYSFYDLLYPGSPFLGEDWHRQVEAAGEAADRLGFSFVQAHAPNYNPLNPNVDHTAGMLAAKRSIEACGKLGIPALVMHSGYTERLEYPYDLEKYFQENLDFYRQLYPEMEKHNVSVLIENSAEGNMGKRCFFMTGAEMAEFLDAADHPLLKACWDIGHGHMRGADQYQEITALGEKLLAVHIQDNHGSRDEHTAPFFGTVDMDAVMRGLIDTGYKGYFTFEADCFLPYGGRAADAAAQPLCHPPLEVKRASLALLYQIGKSILSAYDCYEY